MAVVKANAYGHGLVATATALGAADALAVARIEEGVLLREAGITLPVVLLEGVFTGPQLAEAAHRDFELVVHDPSQIALLEAFGRGRRFTVWIKVDTGMNRLGFRPEDFPAALERLRALPVPPREIRLLTHLARADERDCAMTAEQVARLQRLLATLPPHAAFAGPGGRPVTSIGNSAGLLGWPAARGDWVRPGLALYGVSPFPGQVGADLGLQAGDDARDPRDRDAPRAAWRDGRLRRRLAGDARFEHRDPGGRGMATACRATWPRVRRCSSTPDGRPSRDASRWT